MANKAKHAFGMLENVDSALLNGLIDAYDILFMKDANGTPHLGWIDANGEKVILKTGKEDVIVIEGESLPESGEIGKIYIFGEDAYVWTGSEFSNLCRPTDVSELQSQVTELGAEIEAKVDAETVQTMIQEHSESAIEVIEF